MYLICGRLLVCILESTMSSGRSTSSSSSHSGDWHDAALDVAAYLNEPQNEEEITFPMNEIDPEVIKSIIRI